MTSILVQLPLRNRMVLELRLQHLFLLFLKMVYSLTLDLISLLIVGITWSQTLAHSGYLFNIMAFDKPELKWASYDFSLWIIVVFSYVTEVSVQRLETKSVARLDEVTVAQYESSPSWLKRQVSMQVKLILSSAISIYRCVFSKRIRRYFFLVLFLFWAGICFAIPSIHFSLASFMVSDSLVWLSQELNSAILKINELLRQRNLEGHHAHQFVLDQDDVQALGLGTPPEHYFFLLPGDVYWGAILSEELRTWHLSFRVVSIDMNSPSDGMKRTCHSISCCCLTGYFFIIPQGRNQKHASCYFKRQISL